KGRFLERRIERRQLDAIDVDCALAVLAAVVEEVSGHLPSPFCTANGPLMAFVPRVRAGGTSQNCRHNHEPYGGRPRAGYRRSRSPAPATERLRRYWSRRHG